MKFQDMPYERPDLAKVKADINALTERLAKASSFEEAEKVFLEKDQLAAHISTLNTLVEIRHSINTLDEFYDKEQQFWNDASPEIEEANDAWSAALLASPFRPEFEAKYGTLIFDKAEQARRCFSPAIMDEMKRENALVQEYEKLIASAQIEFEGGTYTLSQLTPMKHDKDDARRLAAWKAEGSWYKDNQSELDRIYDELVHVRDAMGKKLGYDNYLPLGYDRMERLSYNREDVERFRKAVRTYVVPVANRVFLEQAKRIGRPYPLSFADEGLTFRSGNPLPEGTPDDIVAAARTFYSELSPETKEFFETMLNGQLMDLLSTKGKAAGGYMTEIPDHKVPFIFANFNGTQGDVDVMTHEAGHAFSYYMNTQRVPGSLAMPSSEACEVHSMSMEFLAWPWIEGFFGKDARKYRYAHLAGALTFIPYGTMVDHFQHLMYEQPELTPAERHATWRRLLAIYMPWISVDGDIPFYGDGMGWQRQIHIYEWPLYYIDYCLAQTVALEIWELSQEDFANAWKHYMAYTRQGGTKAFTDLVAGAELVSPFDEACLRSVCEHASKWLESYDLTGIE